MTAIERKTVWSHHVDLECDDDGDHGAANGGNGDAWILDVGKSYKDIRFVGHLVYFH